MTDLIREHSPREMGDRFQLIIDVQLGAHQNKSERIDKTGRRAKNPGIHALVFVIDQRVDRVSNSQRITDVA